MFYVYILQSKKDSKLYYGYTPNLRVRLKRHNNGKVNSTKYRRPFELIYYEAYKDCNIAQNRERDIKRSGKTKTNLKKRLNLNKNIQLKVPG